MPVDEIADRHADILAKPEDHQDPVDGVAEIDQGKASGDAGEARASADREGGVSARDLLVIARNQIGTSEDPPESNNNKYTDWYGVDTPWCAIFISWLFYRADAEDLVLKAAWCPDQARWFQRRERWGQEPRKGGIVYYDWGREGSSGYNHVGIVEEVRSDGEFVTIEGNWDDAVRRVVRDMEYVVGFGYPAYEGAAAPPPSKEVSLSAVRRAAKADPDREQGGTTPGSVEHVEIVETALHSEGLLSGEYDDDGSFGSLTVEAYAAWQRRCGYSGSDADGIPGRSSLQMLGDRHGFRVVD